MAPTIGITGYSDDKGHTEYTIKTGESTTSHRFTDFKVKAT